MLPDYPKIKNKLLKMMNEFLIKYIRKDPLFSQIREEVHFEGNKMSIKTQNGMIDVSLYKKIEESFEIRPEEIITKGCLFLVENAIKIGREFKRKRAQLLFSKIDEITKKTGAQIKGQPFTFDTFLKALEKIEIEFDEKLEQNHDAMQKFREFFYENYRYKKREVEE